MVVNDMGVSDIFVLDSGASISLIGIDFDGLSSLGYGKANRIISMKTNLLDNPKPGNIIENIYINRCKMHNVAQSAIGANAKTDTVTIKNLTVVNSYIYDSDLRGIYIKDFYQNVNVNPYVFKNITYWNIGQQFNWIQVLTPDVTSKWVFDHITGYNIGTIGDKELWGNSEKYAKYDIQFTNIILSEQPSSDQPSLYFTSQNKNSVNGVHSHTIRNIALHNVNEVKTRGVDLRGDATDIITMQNVLYDDPQFADPANGDFTIGNTDYLTAGTDGSVLSAIYWAPGFVDDFHCREYYFFPELTDLQVDGVTILNFSPEIYTYTYHLELGTTQIPVISASADSRISIEIRPATNLTGTLGERTCHINLSPIFPAGSCDYGPGNQYNVEFVLGTSSFNTKDAKKSVVFPSIVKNELFINHFETISQVEVISLSGKSILVDSEHTNAENIDVSFLQAGIYIIKLRSETGIYTDRFIKE